MSGLMQFNFDDDKTVSMSVSENYLVLNYLVYYHLPEFDHYNEMARLKGTAANKVSEELEKNREIDDGEF